MPEVRIVPWAVAAPVLAVLCLPLTWGRDLPALAVVVVALLLGGAVLAAVHHAEVVAHRVGEPFGSLVLAVAVTVIEVGLIVTLMVSGDPESATLARDTVFAAVMITCNGILGLSVFAGALRRGAAHFNAEGSATAFATVLTLAVVCLVLPSFTSSAAGPSSRRRSWPSPPWPRWRCTGCSCSCRRCATATTSCRSRTDGAAIRPPRRPAGGPCRLPSLGLLVVVAGGGGRPGQDESPGIEAGWPRSARRRRSSAW